MKKWIYLSVISLFAGLYMNAQSLAEAQKMIRYGKFESAKKILSTLAGDDVLYELGLAEISTENISAAQSAFEKIKDVNLKNAGMATLLFRQGKNAEALTLVEQIVKKVKKKDFMPFIYAARATAASNSQVDYLKGIEWYKAALAKSQDANVLVALGDLYRKTDGGGGPAMSSYENATRLDPQNSLSYSRQAELWYNSQTYDSVLKLYNLAKQYDPENPQPYGNLANAYAKRGNYELAKENIEKYLELSDKNEATEVKYLNILFMAKYYKEAIQKANEIIGTKFEKPYMYRVLGESYLELNETDKGLTAFENFFAKSPESKVLSTDYLALGKLNLKRDSINLADQNFEKYAAMDTAADRFDVFSKIGGMFKDAKSYKLSAKYYSLCLGKAKPSPADFFWAGVMNYYAEDFDKSAEIFTKMQNLHPEQTSGYYWCGNALAHKDADSKTGIALPHYTKYLELVGENAAKKDERVASMLYIALVNFNQGNKTVAKEYCNKIIALDAKNANALALLKSL